MLSYLATGMTDDEIVAAFTQLTREDVRACLAYAAERDRLVRNSILTNGFTSGGPIVTWSEGESDSAMMVAPKV